MQNSRNRSQFARWAWSVLLLVLTLSTINACQTLNESGDTVPKRDINAVMEDHVDELMAIPKVVGVAIGQLDDKTPCILVLVVEQTDEIAEKVPAKLEGHPVSVFVSGEIKPLGSD